MGKQQTENKQCCESKSIISLNENRLPEIVKPSRQEAEEAVRTLIKWAGDNPDREGLLDTPKRVVKAYEELFAGYNVNPEDIIRRTFEESGGYDDMVTLTDIRLESFCEHHMLPVIGNVHIAYIPDTRVVGISKLARLVEVYAKRLQRQEALTAQVAETIDSVLKPKGVAVIVEAKHHCMTTRGIHKPGVEMTTRRMTGIFREQPSLRREFLNMIGLDK